MLFIFLFMLTVAVNPSIPMDGAKSAVSLCLFAVIPSLFPFFVLNHILLKSGALSAFCNRYLKVFPKIFKLPPSAAGAVILGFLSGYPAGSKAAGELLEKGELSMAQYKRLTAFCSNAGPVFITGTVGTGIFNSQKIGLLLFAVHFASAIAVGLLLSLGKTQEEYQSAPPQSNISPSYTLLFTEGVYESLKSVAVICGYVIFFGTINAYLNKYLAFLPELTKVTSAGIIEMTNGISSIASANIGMRLKLSLVSGLLGWGGICVHAQSFVFLKSKKTYLSGKAIQGVLSFLITYLCYRSGVTSVKAAAIMAVTIAVCFIASKAPRQSRHF